MHSLGSLVMISIHAPTRGATNARYALCVKYGISIHAPTRGATVALNKSMLLEAISIHAPTRGATFLFHCSEFHLIYFNPRSHKGSDSRSNKDLGINREFQSTLPQGERRLKFSIDSRRVAFQSTLPQGERLIHVYPSRVRVLFQSTLPQGERH